MPGNNNKLNSQSKTPSILVAVFLGGIGLIAMLFTSDSYIQELLSVTDTLPNNTTKPTPLCIESKESSFIIENGKLIPNETNCTNPQLNTTETTEPSQQSLDTNESYGKMMDVYNTIGEYTIRTTLNQRPELTAQIDTIEPIELTKQDEAHHILYINVHTLEQGILPYSLVLANQSDLWQITNAFPN